MSPLFRSSAATADTRLVGALLPGKVAEVLSVRMEHAPVPVSDYLDDRTAFDAFIEYRRPDGALAGLGIEPKLTEPFSRKRHDQPAYRRWMDGPRAPWRQDARARVAAIRYNQLWRDHLLAVAVRDRPHRRGDFDCFVCIAIISIDGYAHGRRCSMNALELNLPDDEIAQEAEEAVRQLRDLKHGKVIQLRHEGSEEPVSIPASAFDLLLRILAHMANGDAVAVVPVQAELTTQQAAELLQRVLPLACMQVERVGNEQNILPRVAPIVDIQIVLAAGLDHREDTPRERTAGCAARALGQSPPDHTRSDRTLGSVVGGLQALDVHEPEHRHPPLELDLIQFG